MVVTASFAPAVRVSVRILAGLSAVRVAVSVVVAAKTNKKAATEETTGEKLKSRIRPKALHAANKRPRRDATHTPVFVAHRVN